ncbi:MAG: succinyl-diaminopimelate desuccinylase [Bauldia sp.]
MQGRTGASDPSPTGAPSAAGILKSLIACRSVTPADAGALDVVDSLLRQAGFSTERLVFSEPGLPDIANLFATIGSGGPHLLFAGHTDVVPAGEEANWRHPPFAGEVADGWLYGRGAVDMKGAVAAFLAAALDWLGRRRGTGRLSFLLTGDEEGPAVNGTAKVLAWARSRGIGFDAALVGEPTSVRALGDAIKVGRRGSLSGTIRVAGRQGHVAYPDRADNPIPRLIALLAGLTSERLDTGSERFQPSNLEIVSVDTGNPAFNVIPAAVSARFNVRFNDRWSYPTLEAWLRAKLDAAAKGRDYTLTLEPKTSDVFLTDAGCLLDPLVAAIRAVTGRAPELSTGGGTSDARFIKDYCPVVEFGLVGETMHQIDERVALADLEALMGIYRDFLDRFFSA